VNLSGDMVNGSYRTFISLDDKAPPDQAYYLVTFSSHKNIVLVVGHRN
jgi:hypothetical protein